MRSDSRRSTAQIAPGLDDYLEYVDRFLEVQGFFDSSGVNTEGGASSCLARQNGTRLARFVEVAAPLLTPEERARLAAALRHEPN